MKFVQLYFAALLAFAVPAHPEPYTEVPSEDRDAQPIKPPRPTYPALAVRARMPGICEVHFDVDSRGYTRHIRPRCTNPVFCQSAEDAVAGVLFAPKLVGGLPEPRSNVVYPLEYRIGDTEADRERRSARLVGKPLKACMTNQIS